MDDQTYLSTVNLKASWKSACKVADAINQLIITEEPAQSFCQCTHELTQTNQHPCEGCLLSTICKRLTVVEQFVLPVYVRCQDGPAKPTELLDATAVRKTKFKQDLRQLSAMS
jgi:hypothetical protein